MTVNITHGEYVGGKRSTEYVAWMSMKQRCYEPTHPAFKDYGGRGIVMCAAWKRDVAAFIADVGRRPSSVHSIDRIDPDGIYEPGNVRWATKTEQSRNRRPSSRSGKLTIDDARRIRALAAADELTNKEIGASFGITGSMVWRIATGRAWIDS